MKPKILERWTVLAESDLEHLDYRFDHLVELIRKRTKPSRSSITIEANIRDWMLRELDKLDKNIS